MDRQHLSMEFLLSSMMESECIVKHLPVPKTAEEGSLRTLVVDLLVAQWTSTLLLAEIRDELKKLNAARDERDMVKGEPQPHLQLPTQHPQQPQRPQPGKPVQAKKWDKS